MRSGNAIVPIEPLLRVLSEKRGYAAYLVVICSVLGIASISWPVLKNHGFPLDDAWIYQVIGRNAARFGVAGFVPGVATGGSSSAIWPWIIAVNYRLLRFASPIVYLLLLNSLCFFAMSFVLFSAAARDGLRSLDVVAIAALPAISGNVAWLLSTGMEHLLFIATAFLAAHFWLSASRGGNADRSVLSGTLFGLSIAARPEAVVFLPLFVGVGWWLGKCRRELLVFLIPCMAFIALVALSNLWSAHSLLPPTFSGRKWMFLAQSHASAPLLALRLLGAWALQIVTFFIGVEHTPASLGYKISVIALCLALAMGLFRLIRLKAFHTLFLICLAAINFMLYCIILPAPGHGMRYQAMSLLFVFPLMALGGIEFVAQLRSESARARHLLQALVLASISGLALSSLVSWSQITEFGIKHINGTQVQMGRWLAEHVPANTPVASFDIGAIGYFGNVRVVDLGGLTDPTVIPYLYSGTAAELLRRRQVQLLVVSAGGPMRAAAMQNAGDADDSRYCDGMTERLKLCDGAELRKKYIVSFATPSDMWDRGFRATLHADQSQILYKIIWN